MIRFLPHMLTLGAVLGLGVYIWALRANNALLTAENGRLHLEVAAQAAVVTQREEAAAVHRAHITRLEIENTEWDALVRDLETLGGGDAPLSDHLRTGSERLWGR